MGTIVARRRKDGTTGYTAQVLKKRGGKVVLREAQTFDRRVAADSWIKKRETELSVPGAIERAGSKRVTLAQAIDRYTDESLKKIGRTKAQVLKSIKEYDIANMDCEKIGSDDIVAFAKELGADGSRTPANGCELSQPPWRGLRRCRPRMEVPSKPAGHGGRLHSHRSFGAYGEIQTA